MIADCKPCKGTGYDTGDFLFCGHCGGTGKAEIKFEDSYPLIDAVTDALFRLGTSLRGMGLMKEKIVKNDYEEVIKTFLALAEGGCDGLAEKVSGVRS